MNQTRLSFHDPRYRYHPDRRLGDFGNLLPCLGAWGQNVNQVASAVSLRFEAERSPNLPGDVKIRLRRLAGRRWTTDGAVVIRAEEHRSQARNREAALERLIELIRKATERPKKRIPTRPSMGAKRRRMDSKTRRGAVKTLRGKVDDD